MSRTLPPAYRPRAIRQHYADVRSLIEEHGATARQAQTDELLLQSYLALFASFEGTLRREFDYQAEFGTGALATKCRALRAQRHSQWIRFDEILDCWKAVASSGTGIGLISNHQAIRDWLAHGRCGRLPDNGRRLLDPVRLFDDLERAASVLGMSSLS